MEEHPIVFSFQEASNYTKPAAGSSWCGVDVVSKAHQAAQDLFQQVQAYAWWPNVAQAPGL